jgi:hypothetical protein
MTTLVSDHPEFATIASADSTVSLYPHFDSSTSSVMYYHATQPYDQNIYRVTPISESVYYDVYNNAQAWQYGVNGVSTWTQTASSHIADNIISINVDMRCGGEMPDGIRFSQGTVDSPFMLSSLADLKCMRDLVNQNQTYLDNQSATQTYRVNKVWRLNANVPMDAYNADDATQSWNWEPIGSSSAVAFSGTVYGYTPRGVQIQGLTITRQTDAQGLFGLVGDLTVSNLHFTGASIVGANSVGALLGQTSANPTNVVLTDVTVSNSEILGQSAVGALAGSISASTLNNLRSDATVSGNGSVGGLFGNLVTLAGMTGSNWGNYGSVSGAQESIGGIAGSFNLSAVNSGTVNLLTNTGQVTGVSLADGTNFTYGVGGLFGQLKVDSTDNAMSLEDFTNYGLISGADAIGGLVGSFQGASSGSAISASRWFNAGAVQPVANVADLSEGVGGLVGSSSLGFLNVTEASNYGSVQGWSAIGGLVGLNQGTGLTVSNGNNEATVSGNNRVGGLVGSIDQTVNPVSTQTINLAKSANSAEVTGSVQVGGAVGYYAAGAGSGSLELSEVSNSGSVDATETVGGIVGQMSTTGPRILLHEVTNEGPVTAVTQVAGGLVGVSQIPSASVIIESSVNHGLITSVDLVGGLVGWNLGDQTLTIAGSRNLGNVYAANTITGGIPFGISGGVLGRTDGTVSLSAVTNSASVSGFNSVGGLIGLAAQPTGTDVTSTLYDVTNSGSIVASAETGGLIGLSEQTVLLENGVNYGSVDGGHRAGGLIGAVDGTVSALTIANWATVDGTTSVGGAFGYASAPLSVNVYYSGGLVRGTSRVAGLVGVAENWFNVHNVVNRSSVLGVSGKLSGILNWELASANLNSTSTLDGVVQVARLVTNENSGGSADLAAIANLTTTSQDTLTTQNVFTWMGTSAQTANYQAFEPATVDLTNEQLYNGELANCFDFARVDWWNSTFTNATSLDFSAVVDGYLPTYPAYPDGMAAYDCVTTLIVDSPNLGTLVATPSGTASGSTHPYLVDGTHSQAYFFPANEASAHRVYQIQPVNHNDFYNIFVNQVLDVNASDVSGTNDYTMSDTLLISDSELAIQFIIICGGTIADGILGHQGTANDPFEISDYDDLVCMHDVVNRGTVGTDNQGNNFSYYDNRVWKFTDDITMSTKDPSDLTESWNWNPIGNHQFTADVESGYWFSGTVYGVGDPTISNLTIETDDATATGWGLFGNVKDVTISNLRLANSWIDSPNAHNVGALVGVISGTGLISDVTNSGRILGSNRVGGLLGFASAASTLTQVSNFGEVVGDDSVGGLVGVFSDTSEFGTTSGQTPGQAPGQAQVKALVKDVDNSAAVLGNQNLGGVLGKVDNNGFELTLTNANNSGSVIGGPGSASVGGIVGTIGGPSGTVLINNLFNFGSVQAEQIAGGILGSDNATNDDSVLLTLVENYGEIVATNYAGGLFGKAVNANVKQSYNAGLIAIATESEVTSDRFVGGLGAYAENRAKIENSLNDGTVSEYHADSSSFSARIGGAIGGSKYAEITNFINLGPIIGHDSINGGVLGIFENSGQGSELALNGAVNLALTQIMVTSPTSSADRVNAALLGRSNTNAISSSMSNYHWGGLSQTDATYSPFEPNSALTESALNGLAATCADFATVSFWTTMGYASTWDFSLLEYGYLPFFSDATQSISYNCMTTIQTNPEIPGTIAPSNQDPLKGFANDPTQTFAHYYPASEAVQRTVYTFAPVDDLTPYDVLENGQIRVREYGTFNYSLSETALISDSTLSWQLVSKDTLCNGEMSNAWEATDAGTESQPLVVSSYQDLMCMRDLVNYGASLKLDKTYSHGMFWQFDQDITASNTADPDDATNSWNWTPIGLDATVTFSGTIYGVEGDNGFAPEIKNLTATGTNRMGLFGQVGDLTVSKLRLTDLNFSGVDQVGGLVAQVGGTLSAEAIQASGQIVGQNDVGGLVGLSDGDLILSAVVNHAQVAGVDNIGGLIGLSGGSVFMKSVANLANEPDDTISGYNFVGGLIGRTESSVLAQNSVQVTIVDSVNSGSVIAGTGAGGLMGAAFGATSISLTDVTNSGDVTSSTDYAGGMIGQAQVEAGFQMIRVLEKGSVRGRNHVGGLAGYVQPGATTTATLASSSVLDASVHGSASYVGGLVGQFDGAVTFAGVQNRGAEIKDLSVSGLNNIGAVFGQVNGTATLTDAFVHASVVGENSVGGLIGMATNPVTLNSIISDVTVSGLDLSGSAQPGAQIAGLINSSAQGTLVTLESVVNVGNLISSVQGSIVSAIGNFAVGNAPELIKVHTWKGLSQAVDVYRPFGTNSIDASFSYVNGTPVDCSEFSTSSYWGVFAQDPIWQLGDIGNGYLPYRSAQTQSVPYDCMTTLETSRAESGQIVPISGSVVESTLSYWGETDTRVFFYPAYEAASHLVYQIQPNRETLLFDYIVNGTLTGTGWFGTQTWAMPDGLKIGDNTLSVVFDARCGGYLTGNIRNHYGTDDDPFQIADYMDLLCMRNLVNEGEVFTIPGSPDQTFSYKDNRIWELVNSFAFPAPNPADTTESWNWIPIGLDATTTFSGKLFSRGSASALAGLTISRPTLVSQGLFGYAGDLTVSNLNLTSVTVSGGNQVGAMVGFAEVATLHNVQVSGSLTGQNSVGGLMGAAQSAELVGVTNLAKVGGQNSVGGIVGSSQTAITLLSSTNSGNVTGTGNDAAAGVGGVVGLVSGEGTFSNLSNFGSVSAVTNVGGILGYGDFVNGTGMTASQLTNAGTIVGTGSNVGGLFGSIAKLTLQNAINFADVSGANRVAGMVGLISGDSQLSSVVNAGTVSGSGDIVGGIVNDLDATPALTLSGALQAARREIAPVTSTLGAIGVLSGSDTSSLTFNNVYHWLGLSQSANSYQEFSPSTSVDAEGIYNGSEIDCSAFTSSTFWAGDMGINAASGWNTSSIASGYLPFLNGQNNDMPYSCMTILGINEVKSGSLEPLSGDPTEEYVGTSLSRVFYYPANQAVNNASYLIRPTRPDQNYDVLLNNVVVLSKLHGEQTYVVPAVNRIMDNLLFIDFDAMCDEGIPVGILSHDGSSEDPFILQNYADLLCMRDLVNEDLSYTIADGTLEYYRLDKNWQLVADVSMSSGPDNGAFGYRWNWDPIGTPAVRFSGKLFGTGDVTQTIFDLTISHPDQRNQGLFGYASDLTISGISLYNAKVQGASDAGIVAGYVDLSVNAVNLQVSGSVTGNSRVGAIVGNSNGDAWLDNVEISGSVLGRLSVGGAIGQTEEASSLNGVRFAGYVESEINQAGGIVGFANNALSVGNTSVNATVISAALLAGGIAGAVSEDLTISDISVAGTISGTDYVGGAVGMAYKGVTANLISNLSTVNGHNSVGGVLGSVHGDLTLSNSVNFGDISGASEVSGLVGAHSGSAGLNLQYLINNGSVIGSGSQLTGIIGSLATGSSTLNGLVNAGLVSGNSSYSPINLSLIRAGLAVSPSDTLEADALYHWHGVSQFVDGYLPFADTGTSGKTASNTYNGATVSCSEFTDQAFWTESVGLNPADGWQLGLTSSGYLPYLSHAATPNATNLGAFNCMSIVQISDPTGGTMGIVDSASDTIRPGVPLVESSTDYASSYAYFYEWTEVEDNLLYRVIPSNAIAPHTLYINQVSAWTELPGPADWTLSKNIAYDENILSIVFSRPTCNDIFPAGITDHDGSEADPFEIASYEDMMCMRDLVNDGFTYTMGAGETATYASGNYWKLVADVTMSSESSTKDITNSYNWKPIGDADSNFTGVFYAEPGQNRTIKGLTITRTGSTNIGLFGITGDLSVSNLSFEDASVTGQTNVGLIAGYAKMLTVSNVNMQGTVSGVYATGGVAGLVDQDVTTTHVFVQGEVYGADATGGVVGYVNNDLTATQVNVVGSASGNRYVGGLFGYVKEDVTATYVSFNGAVLGNESVGGIIGYTNRDVTLSEVISIGSVSGGMTVGGIIGASQASVNLINGFVNATLTSKLGYIGGVIGRSVNFPYSVELTDVTVTMQTDSDSGAIGGLVGYHNIGLSVTRATVNALISSRGDQVGGVVGLSQAGINLQQIWVDATISAKDYVGGLVGAKSQSGTGLTISNAQVDGTISGYSSVGAMIGEQNFTGAQFTNLINNASVTGHDNVAGLVGLLGAPSTFNAAIQTGDIVAESSSAAGIANLYSSLSAEFNSVVQLGRVVSSPVSPAALVNENYGGTVSNGYYWGGTSATLDAYLGFAATSATTGLNVYNGTEATCADFSTSAFWTQLAAFSADWDISRVGEGYLPKLLGSSSSASSESSLGLSPNYAPFSCMTILAGNSEVDGTISPVNDTLTIPFQADPTLTFAHYYWASQARDNTVYVFSPKDSGLNYGIYENGIALINASGDTTYTLSSAIVIGDNTMSWAIAPPVCDSEQSSGILKATGTEDDPFVVNDYVDLMCMRDLVNTDVTFTLTPGGTKYLYRDHNYWEFANDITMSNTFDMSDPGNSYNWVSIGASVDRPFSGVVYGTISNGVAPVIANLFIERPSATNQGWFGFTQDLTISDLTLSGASVELGPNSAILVGNVAGAGVFSGLEIDGTFTATQGYGALLLGNAEAGWVVDDVTFSGAVYTKNLDSGYLGAIIGHNTALDSTITRTVNQVQNYAQIAGKSAIGALFGGSSGLGFTAISHAQNFATVSGSTSVGGLVGSVDSTLSMFNVINDLTATISGTEAIGGLVGSVGPTAVISIESATNSAEIMAAKNAGGLIGLTNGVATLSNLFNYGALQAQETILPNNFGGIIGLGDVGPSALIDIRQAYNYAAVTGPLDVSVTGIGGIVGRADSTLTLTDVHNRGLVAGYTEVGALLGTSSAIGDNTLSIVDSTQTALVSAFGTAGGLVGAATQPVELLRVSVDGTVSGHSTLIGGYIGRAAKSVNLKDAYADVTVSGTGSIGGLLGTVSGELSVGEVRVQSEVRSTSGSLVGGVVGQAAQVSIDGLFVNTNVSGSTTLGGVLANANDGGTLNGISINRLEVDGSVRATGAVAAAVLGLYSGSSNGSGQFNNVINYAHVSASNRAAGIVADTFVDNVITLTSVINAGNIELLGGIGTGTVAGLVSTGRQVELKSTINSGRVTQLSNLSGALAYSAAHDFMPQNYHWDGLSGSSSGYMPYPSDDDTAQSGSIHGTNLACAIMQTAEFWSNTDSMNLTSTIWEVDKVANGYLPRLVGSTSEVPFYCLSRITADPSVGTVTPVGYDESWIMPSNPDTFESVHVYPANVTLGSVGYHLQSAALDIWYDFVMNGSTTLVAAGSTASDYMLPNSVNLSAGPSFALNFSILSPKPTFSVSLSRNDQGFIVLSWSSKNVSAASFSGAIRNPFNGYGFVKDPASTSDRTPVEGSGNAGSKTLGRYVFGAYSGNVAVTMTSSVTGTSSQVTLPLSLTNTFKMSTQPSATSFPDVFTGDARTITYKNNSGRLTVTRVSAVNSARMDSIQWLASVGVTGGSQSDQNNVTTFRPGDTVNRGAMAQFLQKLAGFTDTQLANTYSNKTTKFTDLGTMKSDNAGRYYAILWLADTGITAGCNTAGTQFCPGNPVNRGAMAEFMRKFVGVEATSANSSPFPDVQLRTDNSESFYITYTGSSAAVRVAKLSAARIGAINWMKDTEISLGSGSSDDVTTYRPQDNVNRGAMAQFMHKLAYLGLQSTTYPPKT